MRILTHLTALNNSFAWQKAYILMLLLFGLNASGQGYQRQITANGPSLIVAVEKGNAGSYDLKTEARKQGIPTRVVSEIKELFNGYYAVAGVFGEEKNAGKFVDALKKQGLEPRMVLNPVSKLHYIYLGYYQEASAAVTAISSGLEGKYSDKLWIMDVRDCKAVSEPDRPATTEHTKYRKEITTAGFRQTAKQNNIATRSMKALDGLKAGYYLIAGVFSELENSQRFEKGLKAKGLNTFHFYDPVRKAYYTYVGYYNDWPEAVAVSASKLGGRYQSKLWILEMQAVSELPIPKGTEVATSIGDEDGSNTSLQPLRAGTKLLDSGKPTLKDPPNLAKLIEKADSYFQKMWYAEAAELYEMVLSKIEQPTYEIIKKAGDSHYFNTNMERAYYWYDQLYDNYKEEMSADNLFKYAHSLKGTGRYGRAKRLMRLYNRKLKEEQSSSPDRREAAAAREALMDNILNTSEQVSLKNLSINSKYSDFGPMFYNDDEIVYASAVDSAFFSTRRYKWNNQPYLDLYVAKINKETEDVRNAVKFSKKVNTKYHEAGVTFSPDNKTLYFTRNNYGKKLRRDKNGVNNLKIYRSRKVDGEWTEAEELPFNSDDYSTGHPALSPDGKQMYFVSDMPGTIGNTDIFVVDVLEDGSFSEPRNLGPEINTERKEMFPFINGQKLYFSSDGHVGLGGLDIFEVAFDGEDGFLEVRNLGRPINSNQDDFSFIVNEETQQGYFASNRRGGKGDDDIYSFKRIVVEETNNNAIAGVVTALVTGDFVPDALVVLLDENNRKLKEVVTGDDGAFVFEDLEGDTKYTLQIEKKTFETESRSVQTLDNEKLEVDIAMKKLGERIVVEEGIRKLKMDMIFFDFDKSYIRPDAAKELDKLVAVMNEYPDMVIKIESHTDSRGPAVYNKYLSGNRAKSTRAYLIKNGIAAERIESATGYGEERLLNECNGSVRCSSEKHQLNRRSEFIIVKM